MAFIREELKDILNDSELLTQRATAKHRQQQERQYVGRQMAELENEPRWRTYTQHLNALKEPHAIRVVVLEKALFSSSYVSSDDYSKIRFELIKEKATAETFEIAKNLVYQLIQDGKTQE